jgi:hypothetical protein
MIVLYPKISKEDIRLQNLYFVSCRSWVLVTFLIGYEVYFSWHLLPLMVYLQSNSKKRLKGTIFNKILFFNDLYKYSFNDTISINNSILLKVQMDSLYLNPIKKGLSNLDLQLRIKYHWILLKI